MHLIDSSFVARHLWEEWVPRITKRAIASSLGSRGDLAESLFVFLAAIHDIGKATPIFQQTPISGLYFSEDPSLSWIPERAGLPFEMGSYRRGGPKHAIAGQVILERILVGRFGFKRNRQRCLSSIIGCHHGKPTNQGAVISVRDGDPLPLGFKNGAWERVQAELFDFALGLAGMKDRDIADLIEGFVPPQAASLLCGLLIMCDWMASGIDAFPLASLSLTEDGLADDSVDESLARVLRHDGDVIDMDYYARRAQRGWRRIDIPPSWQEPESSVSVEAIYDVRFGFPEGSKPRPVQSAAAEVAAQIANPGLFIIEAPMGEGKTEAALAAAELFAIRTGAGGVCVALPTMATTDAMFGRVHEWLKHLPQGEDGESRSTYLAHGKTRLNEEFQGIVRGGRRCAFNADDGARDGRAASDVVISDWMYGRKRGMLANFVVCTVDQVLMGALQMRHLPMRHLALANKVVIVDECHAYDMYMQQYLNVMLEWLGSWHVPVILLSATLPPAQREEMLDVYRKARIAAGRPREARRCRRKTVKQSENMHAEKNGPVISDSAIYPLLTYTDGAEVKRRTVDGVSQSGEIVLSVMSDDLDSLASLLRCKLAQGGCAGVICDTVGRAQEAADALIRIFGERDVTLVHARFTDFDRMENERRLRTLLGPSATLENGKRPYRHIVVGTQVLEQSLDIDFDVLVTDIAPIDLLFQRMGRCHRHARASRPETLGDPRCYMRGIVSWEQGIPHFDHGVQKVYESASLLETLAVCSVTNEGAIASFALPDDIARLVRLAYDDGAATSTIPQRWLGAYEEACDSREMRNNRKRERARHCLLKSAEGMMRNASTLTDWYDAEVPAKERDEDWGPRAVRDTQESVEVMALHRVGDSVYLLQWIGDSAAGVEPGAEVSTDVVPDDAIAKVAAQSTVRLPISICAPDRIEELVTALETMDGRYAGSWQESYWMQGQLALLLEDDDEGDLSTVLDLGARAGVWKVAYARRLGLTVYRLH